MIISRKLKGCFLFPFWDIHFFIVSLPLTKPNTFTTMKITSAKELLEKLTALSDGEQKRNLMRFFKTGKGDYGEGDEFLGLKVPQTRSFVKDCVDMDFGELQLLINSEYHEARLAAVLILVEKYKKLQSAKLKNNLSSMAGRDSIIDFYVRNYRQVNNWDLVDMSAPKLLGNWIVERTIMDQCDKEDVIEGLANSGNLWGERMSVVFTWMTVRHSMPEYSLRYCRRHLKHPHDLMHKAVGWMLREMGSRIDMDLLRDFLDEHCGDMPRTTLRYAIEKMDERERKEWLERK